MKLTQLSMKIATSLAIPLWGCFLLAFDEPTSQGCLDFMNNYDINIFFLETFEYNLFSIWVTLNKHAEQYIIFKLHSFKYPKFMLLSISEFRLK